VAQAPPLAQQPASASPLRFAAAGQPASQPGPSKLDFSPPARVSLRFLQWNIRDGCAAAPRRLGRLGRWVVRHSPDVLTINELNGWNEGALAAFGSSLGLPHVAFLQTPWGYHLGILSRVPLSVELSQAAAPFHHGVLVVQLAGIRLMLTHLSPADATARFAEARELVHLGAGEGPVMLTGDLNTLSALDVEDHRARRLNELLMQDESLARKFSRPEDQGGGIDYSPMELLLVNGFHDAAHSSSSPRAAGGGPMGGSCASESAEQNYSVPTMINADAMHAAPMRLDYALVNDALRSRCYLNSRLVRDPETETLSDHYPLLTDVLCDFDSASHRLDLHH